MQDTILIPTYLTVHDEVMCLQSCVSQQCFYPRIPDIDVRAAVRAVRLVGCTTLPRPR